MWLKLNVEQCNGYIKELVEDGDAYAEMWERECEASERLVAENQKLSEDLAVANAALDCFMDFALGRLKAKEIEAFQPTNSSPAIEAAKVTAEAIRAKADALRRKADLVEKTCRRRPLAITDPPF